MRTARLSPRIAKKACDPGSTEESQLKDLMAIHEHLSVLRRGIPSWNLWRRENATVIPDLSKAVLVREQLLEADLSRVDLTEADLTKADLTRATLREATLCGAHLNSADLTNSDLRGADLTKAVLAEASLVLTDLSGTKLLKASLIGAFLDRTKLTGARFQGCYLPAIFVRVDLSVVPDLDLVAHIGPSPMDIDTIYLSKGQLSEGFLRAAGLPDTFIAFAKALAANPIEFYSCFISYSTKDQDFADRLHADLQAKGVRCWFAPRDAQRGRKLHEQIDEAIRVHEKLLLILSPDSMNSSWVKTEIANARTREQREGVQMLFPVSVPYRAIRDWKCFDADTGIDSAREIREYLIADFSNWKDHDSYQKEFDALLRDLQSKRKTTGAS